MVLATAAPALTVFRAGAAGAGAAGAAAAAGPPQESACFGTRSGDMLIVDPAFRQQFDIARPSPRYQIILKSLPNTFVGRLSDLQSLVDIMVAEWVDAMVPEEPSWPRDSEG